MVFESWVRAKTPSSPRAWKVGIADIAITELASLNSRLAFFIMRVRVVDAKPKALIKSPFLLAHFP